MIQTVIKRDGRKEPFNPQKCNDWIKWASADIQEHVDWSSIVLKTIRTMPEEVTAKQLQDAMIRTCLDMNSYGYNKMAGRLYSQALKKEIYAWNNRKHPHIKDLHERMIAAGVIVKPNYSDEEYNEINKMLRHERDLTYAHYSLHLIVSKYALQDRVRKVAYETPQFAMMRVAMQAMNNYHKEDRLQKLEELYTHISFQRLCVPTPYWSSSLTKNTNVASCCVIKSDDTAESIGVATTLAYSMTCAGAGIGLNLNTRSIGAAVRGGAIQHTGKIPYYRYAAAAVKSSKQGCYDDVTEILTSKGWKLGVELTEDDNVAQVNDDLSFSFIKPKRIINYDYNGRMYRLLCENAYDLLLTPEHKVWFTKHPTYLEKEYWHSIEVKDFDPSNDTILHSTRYSSPEELMPLSGVFVEKTQENYSGKVWCVEVETGRVLVKRNGIIHVSGNSRGGALTMYYPFTDPELFDLLILKNPLTVTAKRLRELDYGVIVNKWLFQRAAKKQDIYLFDSSQAPELYESIYTDAPEEFEVKMLAFAEANSDKVKAVPALDVLKAIMKERMETGRVYLFFADEVNRHTPFKETIYSSNLCVTGDQWVVTDKGMFTAKELHDLNENLVLFDGEKAVQSSPMIKRGENVPVYRVTTKSGVIHDVTDYHKIMTTRGLVQCKDLIIGKDKIILNNSQDGLFGRKHYPEAAWLFGLWQGDGTSTSNGDYTQYILETWEGKTDSLNDSILETYIHLRDDITGGVYEARNQFGTHIRKYREPKFSVSNKKNGNVSYRLVITALANKYEFTKTSIPKWIREGDRETQLAYIKGLFQTDGTYSYSEGCKTNYLSISSIHGNFLNALMVMLNNLGYKFGFSSQRKSGTYSMPDGNGGMKLYECDDSYRLVCGHAFACKKFEEETGFISFRGKEVRATEVYKQSNADLVKSIEYIGEQDVYCPTVDTEEHVFVCNGIITGNCSEIALVTKGYNSYEDIYNTESEGITAFCNLAGITLDKISSDEEYQDVAYYALLMIDEGINNAELGFPQLNKSIRDWRSAGVGVLGLAHLMAKNKLSYTSREGKDFIHRLAERHSYALHKAAVRLTKERGLAPNIHRTKYPEGWLPIDTYNRNVDELTKEPLHFDWESLREEIKALGGLHFTVLDTIPPSETSSQACETNNAIYPIREGSIVKVSGDTTTNFVAPEYESLKEQYDIAWEVPTKDMISIYAIWQKFISQGISCDFWIDRSQNRDVSTKQLIQELFWCNKYGLKGNYYYNTKMDADVVAGAIASTTFEENEPSKEQQDEPGCGSGGCTL